MFNKEDEPMLNDRLGLLGLWMLHVVLLGKPHVA